MTNFSCFLVLAACLCISVLKSNVSVDVAMNEAASIAEASRAKIMIRTF